MLGAILETVKPIDDSTINLNTGLRYAGAIWRSDFGYSGSYYRDQYLSYLLSTAFFNPLICPTRSNRSAAHAGANVDGAQ